MISRLIGESVTPSLPDDKAMFEVSGSEITRINRLLDLFERYVRATYNGNDVQIRGVLHDFTPEEDFFLQGLVKK